MATSTDIHAYRILADHFEYVCRSSGRKKDASPEVISLQMLISKVNSAFVTAGRAVRTENERLYVLEIKDRVEALVAGKAVPITDPMRFLEMAVLEGDPEGALEYFQGLQGITKNLAFEYLCKYYGPIQGNLIEDGTEHLKKDPISALLFADQKEYPSLRVS